MTQASPRGTYLQVSESLRQQIKNGDITAGLPSEARLMSAHKVSRTTIRRALEALRTAGLIESEPGRGWRVVPSGGQPTVADRMTELLTSRSVGDAFPSEAKLCADLGLPRSAVRRALAELQELGLLEAVPGKGRFVRALPTAPANS